MLEPQSRFGAFVVVAAMAVQNKNLRSQLEHLLQSLVVEMTFENAELFLRLVFQLGHHSLEHLREAKRALRGQRLDLVIFFLCDDSI